MKGMPLHNGEQFYTDTLWVFKHMLKHLNNGMVDFTNANCIQSHTFIIFSNFQCWLFSSDCTVIFSGYSYIMPFYHLYQEGIVNQLNMKMGTVLKFQPRKGTEL